MAERRRMLDVDARQLEIAAAAVFEGEVDHIARRQLRHYLVRITIAYFLILFGSVAAVYVIARNADRDRRTAATGECHRVQVLRTELNRFVGSVYGFVDAARLARQGDYARNHLASDRYAIRAYTSIEAAIFYLPPTNCRKAVRGSYQPPDPIPYRNAVRAKLVPPPPGTVPPRRRR